MGRINKYMGGYICNLYIDCDIENVLYFLRIIKERCDMMTTTEAQKRASRTYQRSLANLSLKVKPELAARYKAAAERAGKPLRAYILEALEEKIARDRG